jgi:hypothetical protein
MICKRCNRTPDEIYEYQHEAKLEGSDPWAFVRENEGTYNEEDGTFLCTRCYILAGTPIWKEGKLI